MSVATTRDPDSFADNAAAIGPQIKAVTLAEATEADVLFLAVRFENHGDVAQTRPSWEGKTIIDVTNAYGVSPDGLGRTALLQGHRAGVHRSPAGQGVQPPRRRHARTDPATHGGHRVVFLASDDEDATADVAALTERLGFAPIKLGGLSEGGLLVQARGDTWGWLIFKDVIKPV